MIKYLYLLLILLLTFIVARINIKLHSDKLIGSEKKEDIILQLNFLESEMKENYLGNRMQAIFPEGYVFMNALYGLSWCELLLNDPAHDEKLRQRAIEEALFAYDNIDSGLAKWNFNENLNPEYGIFYNGWRNYLLSKILISDASLRDSTFYSINFKRQCESIINAMRESRTPYLQSYYNQSWPADMFLAVASLSNHNKIYEPRYTEDIELWIQQVKNNLDPKAKMIPHKVNSKNAETIQGARGVSMVLMLRVLAEINSEFAFEQYSLFKQNYITRVLGLPAVREYPKGASGAGDIDSGPVLFGIGFAATIVSIGTLSIYGDIALANQQFLTVHAFGFDRVKGNKKKYLYGLLPIADAFITWSRAVDLGNSNIKEYNDSVNWRLKFHIVSIAIILIIWLPFYRRKIKKVIKKYF